MTMTMTTVVRRACATLLALGLLSACSRPAHESWKPTGSPTPVDLSTFTSRYEAVISNITQATASSGFTWSTAAPTQTTVSKNGLCSWRLEQTGTYTSNGQNARDLRNTINRALVANGFHASGLYKGSTSQGSDDTVMSSVDSHVALLEVTLGSSPTIDVYSPASGKTC